MTQMLELANKGFEAIVTAMLMAGKKKTTLAVNERMKNISKR